MNPFPTSAAPDTLSLSGRPGLDFVTASLQQLTAWMRSLALPDTLQHHAQLALEELAVNVATHGQAGQAPARHITVQAQWANARLKLQVADDGPAFNPLQAPEPDPLAELDAREVGGLGLFLLRQLGCMTYTRDGAWNRVELILA